MRRLLFSLLALGAALLAPLAAQEPLRHEQIRIQIWSELEAYPGLFGDEDFVPVAVGNSVPVGEAPVSEGVPAATDPVRARTIAEADAIANGNRFTDSARGDDLAPFAHAISRAREITPFLLSGMIDGWAFEYVPSDKTRQVAEYFDFSEVRGFDKAVNPITYRDPVVQDNRLLCWASCDRTPAQQLAYQRWLSILHPKVKGHGTAPVSAGFAGIQTACANAVKDAVREYWRTRVQNKPKEISGTVLLIQDPRIYIYEGQYVVDLDFFLKTDRIALYSYY